MAKVKELTEDEMLEKFEDFLDKVETDGFNIIPSKSKFAKHMGIRPTEVYRWCSLHPHADAKMKKMTADTISAGAMLKHYNPSASALALKNWCGWEESPKTDKVQASKNQKAEKKAEDMLDEYIKEKRSRSQIGTASQQTVN